MTAKGLAGEMQLMSRLPHEKNGWAYSICQLAGWGGVALFGRIMEALQALASPATEQLQDHGFLPLTCVAGLTASHVMRLLIRRGHWLEMPPAKLILRYALALAVSTLLLSLIGVLFFKSPTARESRTETFTIAMMINSSLMGAWMAIYFLFHFYEAFHRAREEQVLLREAVTRSQLEALRLQLNPHFLFNALNSIRALIPPAAPEAREGVTRLAGVLRSTLLGKTMETISFARELEVVRDYLAIEKLRFADHLRIVEDIDPALDPIPIPPLMLLTLVENAIKHGVQLHEQAAALSLAGSLADGIVTLFVESPGSESQSSAHSSLGIGLRNVRERLHLIYGSAASAVLEAVSESTMRCTLRYPATPPSKS
jgi:LytS/YehU family sensor histidine kinase